MHKAFRPLKDIIRALGDKLLTMHWLPKLQKGHYKAILLQILVLAFYAINFLLHSCQILCHKVV